MSHGTVLPISDVLPDVDPAALVAVSFLAAYPNANTRDAYRRDLQFFFGWCVERGPHPLRDVKRAHIQAYASHLLTDRGNSAATVGRRIGTLSGYYRTAVLDEMLEHSPAHHIKLPPIHEDPAKRTWLNRWELGAVMRAAQESKRSSDWALVTLLGRCRRRDPRPIGMAHPTRLAGARRGGRGPRHAGRHRRPGGPGRGHPRGQESD